MPSCESMCVTGYSECKLCSFGSFQVSRGYQRPGSDSMLSMKFMALALAVSFLFMGSTSSGCHSQSGNSQANKDMPQSNGNNSSEPKVVAEGFHSSITTAF